jgi:hypothetical protein
MLRFVVALLFALSAIDAKAQSIVVTEATRNVVAVTMHCGGTNAEWMAFQPLFDTYRGREVDRGSSFLRVVEFSPAHSSPIFVFDAGSRKIICLTSDISSDVSGYIESLSVWLGRPREERSRRSERGGERWTWDIAPSSSSGRKGWRDVWLTVEQQGGASKITVAYFNY